MEPWHWWWPAMGLMWLFPLLFLVVLIVFLFRGPRWFSRDDDRAGRRETAREILDRRYASGEVTKEQYEDMKQTIER